MTASEQREINIVKIAIFQKQILDHNNPLACRARMKPLFEECSSSTPGPTSPPFTRFSSYFLPLSDEDTSTPGQSPNGYDQKGNAQAKYGEYRIQQPGAYARRILSASYHQLRPISVLLFSGHVFFTLRRILAGRTKALRPWLTRTKACSILFSTRKETTWIRFTINDFWSDRLVASFINSASGARSDAANKGIKSAILTRSGAPKATRSAADRAR